MVDNPGECLSPAQGYTRSPPGVIRAAQIDTGSVPSTIRRTFGPEVACRVSSISSRATTVNTGLDPSAPPCGAASCLHLISAPGKSCRPHPLCRSGGIYPPRILFGFAGQASEEFGLPQKPKPGLGYYDRRSSRRSGSVPESRRINFRTASGSRIPRIEAPLLIRETPGENPFATSWFYRSVSWSLHIR